jgi:hypothetical protein
MMKHSETSPKHADTGAVCARYVRCGRAWCNCMRGGPKHGPYYSRYWREGGKRHKEYVRLADAEGRRAACDERRQGQHQFRQMAEDSQQAWRTLLGALREYERLTGG